MTQGAQPFPLDPDLVVERLDALMMNRKVDISLLVEQSPVELTASRRRMKLQLSRYGRMDAFAWERRDVNELRFTYAELVDMMKEESALHRATEES